MLANSNNLITKHEAIFFQGDWSQDKQPLDKVTETIQSTTVSTLEDKPMINVQAWTPREKRSAKTTHETMSVLESLQSWVKSFLKDALPRPMVE